MMRCDIIIMGDTMNGNLYFFYGDNQHLIKSKTDQILESKSIDAADVETFDLDESSLVSAINAAMTIPFLSEAKAVILTNIHFLSVGYKQDIDERDLAYFSSYLVNPNPTTVLILQCFDDKLDVRKQIYKDIQATCTIEQCLAAKKEDHYHYIKTRIEAAGKQLDANALEEFINRVGDDNYMIENELDKLLLYSGDQTKIDIKTVKEVTIRTLESKIYLLVNAVIQKDQWSVSSIYQDLMRINTEPTAILTLIAYKFQEMLYTHALLRMNKKQEDIMKYFNATKGRAYYIMRNASEISEADVMSYLSELAAIDYEIKSGQIDKRIAIEMFLYRTRS